MVRGANGVDVPLYLSYEFVRHLPTEDCELLVGYQVDRRRTRLHVLDGLVLVRVARSPLLADVAKKAVKCLRLGDALLKLLARWDRYSFVASTGGATSVRDLVVNDERRLALEAQLREDYREDREFVAAGIVLTHAEGRELEALDHAVSWGLVPAASKNGIERGIRGRFDSARERLLRAEWNRAAKEVQVIQAQPDEARR